jgi:L-lysine exporter family protein LysE/ArgO
LLTCAALTFLNPHVYLDTVVLLGALANQHPDGRWLFGVGAVTASAVWFVSLGLGARRLAGLFATPVTWRILDGVIAVTMIALGASLMAP